MFNKQPLSDPIAKKRHRITIYQVAGDATRDSYGRRLHQGALLATVWAERQDWGGDESQEGGRETASVTTKYIVRYRADVTPGMTIVEGSDTYNILSALDFDGTKRDLVLNCRKVVP